jgi:hypothetical protein
MGMKLLPSLRKRPFAAGRIIDQAVNAAGDCTCPEGFKMEDITCGTNLDIFHTAATKCLIFRLQLLYLLLPLQLRWRSY